MRDLRQRLAVRIMRPNPSSSLLRGALVWLGLWIASMRGAALIFFGTADPAFHTSSPTGEFADAGWQWEVTGGFCATVVGPRHILSARHLSLPVGIGFGYQGLPFRAIRISSPDAGDLSLMEIAGRMPNPAPLYRGTNEPGATLFMTGRGTQRGDPVLGPPPDGTQVQGWRWGANDGTLRWGTNLVGEVYTAGPNDGVSGDFLVTTFSNLGGDDLVTLSVGDSGSGAFLRDDDGLWKLAGVNYGVEGRFNTSTNGDGFYAAIFDRTGLFEYDDNQSGWIIDLSQASQPGTASYLTRIASNVDWLDAEMAKPSTIPWPRLLSSATVDGPFDEHSAYSVLMDDKTITIFPTDTQRFFRLQSEQPLQLKGPRLQEAFLVFTYE